MSWLPPELIAIIGLYLSRDELSVMSLSCQAYHDALRAIIFQNIKIDSDEALCQLDELPKIIANAAVRHVTLRHREGISMAYHQAYNELARFSGLKSLKVEISDKESCLYTHQPRPGYLDATGFTHMLYDLRHLVECLSRIELPIEHLAIKLESSHLCEPLSFRDLPSLPPLKTFSVNFGAFHDDLEPNFNLLLLSALTPSQHTLTTLDWNIMVELEEIDELAPIFALMPNVTDITFIWYMLCLDNADELEHLFTQFALLTNLRILRMGCHMDNSLKRTLRELLPPLVEGLALTCPNLQSCFWYTADFLKEFSYRYDLIQEGSNRIVRGQPCDWVI